MHQKTINAALNLVKLLDSNINDNFHALYQQPIWTSITMFYDRVSRT